MSKVKAIENNAYALSNFPPFEKRGTKSDEECVAFLLKFYQDRCSRPQNGASFEERVAILSEYGIYPVQALLTRFLQTKTIEPVKPPFSVKYINALYTVIFTPHGDEKPMVAAEKAYRFVESCLKEFIQVKIRPTMDDTATDLTAQAGVCWTAYDMLGKWLKFYFKTKSDNYSRALKLPDLDSLISQICFSDFFGSVKDKLTAKLSKEIKELRLADWQRNTSSTCVFYDDDRYGYLNKTIELFIKVDDMRKLGIKTYKECIEAAVLEDMRQYYGSVSKSWALSLPTYSPATTETYINQVFTSLTLERMRSGRCLHPTSLAQVDSVLVSVFLREYVRSTKPFFQEIYDSLFSFERYIKEETGNCSEMHKSTSAKLFEMLAILDKSEGTTYVNAIGNVLSKAIERDFGQLIEKFKPVINLIKAGDKEQKENVCKFFFDFFVVFQAYVDNTIRIFNSNAIIEKCTSEVYAKVINTEVFGKSFSSAIAVYVDCNLLKSKPKIFFETTEKFLSNTIQICHYVEDKLTLFGLFQDDLFYRITDESVEDFDKERAFQSKLTAHFGLKQVMKLSRLLTSVADSQELIKNLTEPAVAVSPAIAGLLEIVPMVLDSGVVVRQKSVELFDAPCSRPFIATFDRLSKLYVQSNSTKKITAMYSLGTCQVSCLYALKGVSRSYTAQMGVLQAIVLSAFHRDVCEPHKDEEGYMVVSQIEHLCGITVSSESMGKDSEVAQIMYKVLASLLRAKLLIQKDESGVGGAAEDASPRSASPRSAEDTSPRTATSRSADGAGTPAPPASSVKVNVNKNSKFKANQDYKNPSKKITVSGLKFEHQEKPAVADEVSHIIDATIVRIMKARKRLKATDLTAEVMFFMKDLYKISDNTIIKRRYESLMEREYMKRDENDNTFFIYT